MAIKEKTTEENSRLNNKSILVTWDNLQAGDVGQDLLLPSSGGVSFQFSGIFGIAQVKLEGSIDGKNYEILKDQFGQDIFKNHACLGMVSDLPKYIRPLIYRADSMTDIKVQILIKL